MPPEDSLHLLFPYYIFNIGLIYLPEIKYRRILNTAFGPGGWGLMPLGDVKHFQVNINYTLLRTKIIKGVKEVVMKEMVGHLNVSFLET